MFDFVHTEATRALAQTVHDRFPHALILEGEPGCGKRTFAKWLGASLLCRAPKANAPCCSCVSCSKCAAGSHPDMRLIQGAGKNGVFLVDQIRAVREEAYIRPFESAYKVFILPEAQNMNEASQNALLKVLEVPPEFVHFILTCTQAGMLLPTVLSRAQIYTLQPPQPASAAAYIRNNYPSYAAQDVQQAVESCGGNIGKALQRLEGESFFTQQQLSSLCSALLESSESNLLEQTAPFIKNKSMLQNAVQALVQQLRDAVLLRAGSRQTVQSACGEELAAALTVKRLLQLQQVCAQTLQEMDKNANMTLLVTAFCAKLRAAAGK